DVRAGVDGFRVGVQVSAGGPGELLVQVGGDVDLRHARLDGVREVGVGHAGRAVQDQRDVHRGTQFGYEGEVQDGVPGGHGVGAAHRHGQGVDPGGGDEVPCLRGIRAHARSVRAVLAADLDPKSVV